ncbi:hypothetical protein JG688_00014510 [Phytophthora aleatoria]|uniref:Uncharacterized protein n=1 Tax=Phytophthora aleatoria TaxID=2496075 RepID=A0A8J5IVA8_9STRA|nr:hypothetical protein JG688_00014510 [Phytophthora aleatoria]
MDMTDMAPQPHPARMLRWEKLNELLGRNKKDKPTVASTGDSYISFGDNEEIMRTGRYEQPSKAIANDKIDTLYAYLLVVIRPFGHMVTGKDVNRLYFILPILACVCERFDGERGSTRVCVVLVKREDFQKGLAQAYLGCEILADVEALTKVYSVVTSFKEWYFNRSLDDKIERTDITMVLTNDIPTRESVKRIAEKIYSMLSDDD